jgi:excisionase family DNA binding protein
MMSDLQFLLPRALLKAIGPARDGEDVGAVIADLAATGQIVAVADNIDDHRHIDHVPDRNEPISTDLWRRIIHQEKVKDVWDRGTVRLESDVKNHLYYVEIIGIKFEEDHIRSALDQFGLKLSSSKPAAAPANRSAAINASPAPAAPIAENDAPVRPRNAPSLNEKLMVTVDQACVTMSLGRTTIYKLIAEGKLVVTKVGGKTLITTESIRNMLQLS